ncbi:hypothetical protein GQ457_01G044670 [Hibiscus cannabinus]
MNSKKDSTAPGVINHCLILSISVFTAPPLFSIRNALMSYPVTFSTLPISYTRFSLSLKRILSFASYARSNIPDTFILVLFALLTSGLNVLGQEGKYVSYICSTCWVIVHKDCTKLPRIIKFSRHAHCLFHKYFLAKQELTRQDCKICFEQVKVERGSYSCVKSGCNYVVHVNCALEDKDLYEVIEQESQCEELCAATQSSIIRVIEVNEDGEATKIEHSSHEGHCLLLANKMEKETDGKCDGCILPVSTPLYYCSESDCHFCLHKNCAEFPRIKQHWFSKSNATLEPKGAQKCAFCRREWSGFFYEIAEHYDVCLWCTEVADIIEYCEGHQHLLIFDFKCKERCNGCGSPSGRYGAFRCKKCSFALDFACLTLPHSALHKCDQHMLYLTYHDDNDYKKHDYCDICEGKRDPSL